MADQPIGGGGAQMFEISLPADTTTPNGGDFTVTPVTPFQRLVITGPTAGHHFVLQPDGVTSIWDIPDGALWTIRIE